MHFYPVLPHPFIISNIYPSSSKLSYFPLHQNKSKHEVNSLYENHHLYRVLSSISTSLIYPSCTEIAVKLGDNWTNYLKIL